MLLKLVDFYQTALDLNHGSPLDVCLSLGLDINFEAFDGTTCLADFQCTRAGLDFGNCIGFKRHGGLGSGAKIGISF